MGLFSGVKLIGIVCALVRNKLIAWLVGPAGLGLVMIYNSIVDLMSQATRLSMDQSAQRDISQASSANVAVTVTVVRRWALWLGLGGMALMSLLSPLISLWSFDTVDCWPRFCALSVVPLCLTYATCTSAQNQGLRRFKALVWSNVTAMVVGLVIVVPLIVFFRIESMLWIIVAYGVTAWLGSYIFRPRIASVDLPRRQIIDKGRSFIRLGAQITLAMFVSQALGYVFVLFLNNYSSTDTLGIYQSGYTMMNSYIGIIFSAIWIEYYPRLSAMAHSPRRLALAASHELIVTALLMTPLLCLLILLINPIVRLIYSEAFLPIVPFMVLGSVGVIFRLSSWCLAYVILASGDGKAYLFTETGSAVIGLGANLAGYVLGGFTGLGIAYIVWYAGYTALTAYICRRRYGMTYSGRAVLTAFGCLLVVAAAATAYMIFEPV